MHGVADVMNKRRCAPSRLCEANYSLAFVLVAVVSHSTWCCGRCCICCRYYSCDCCYYYCITSILGLSWRPVPLSKSQRNRGMCPSTSLDIDSTTYGPWCPGGTSIRMYRATGTSGGSPAAYSDATYQMEPDMHVAWPMPIRAR